MQSIIAPLLLIAAYLAFGRKLYYAIGLKKTPGLIYPASFALSVVFAGTFMAFAGFLGIYTPFTGYLLAAGMLLVSYKEASEMLSEVKPAIAGMNFKGAAVISFAAAAVWGAYVFLAALTPPTYYDSLTYHLGTASQYIARGGANDLPGNIFSYFPQLISMNYLLCLLLSGPGCVKLFQFFTAAMAVVAVLEITRHYKGDALVSAALIATSPLFVLNATRAGVDVPVMFFFALLFLFVIKKTEEGFNMADNIFIGIILGAALASKYTSAILYLFFTGYLAIMCFRKKETPAGLAAAAFVPLLVIAPYLVKNFIYTGNPVYPFLTGLIPGKPGLAGQAADYVAHVSGFGPGMNIMEFIKSPWTMNVNPAVFGGDAAAGLILITFFLIICGLARCLKTAVLFLLFYYVAWYFTGPVLRFLLPAEAICAVIAAVVYSRAGTKARVFALGALLFVQILASVYFVEKYLKPFTLFSAPVEKYISKSVSYYKAALFINGYNKNNRTVLLLGEARVFYFKVPVVSYTVFNRAELLSGFEPGRGEYFMEKFRGLKAGYVMVNRAELLRLKDAGFGAVFKAYNGPEFKNIMDKYFKKLYIDTDCEIYEYKG